MAKSGMPALDSTTLLIIVVIVVVIIFVVYFFNKERESFACYEGFAADLPKCGEFSCNSSNVGKKCTLTYQGKTSTGTCNEKQGLKGKYYQIE